MKGNGYSLVEILVAAAILLSGTMLAVPLAGGQFQTTAYAFQYKLNLFSNFTYFLNDPVNGDQFEQADQRLVLGGSLARLLCDILDRAFPLKPATQAPAMQAAPSGPALAPPGTGPP